METTVKTAKVSTVKGLARVMVKSYQSWADICLMKDDEGYYLLGFARASFPSSNNDEVIARFSGGYWKPSQIEESLINDYEFEIKQPIEIRIF